MLNTLRRIKRTPGAGGAQGKTGGVRRGLLEAVHLDGLRGVVSRTGLVCTVSWQVAEGRAVSWRVPLCTRSLGNCGSVVTTILEGMALLAESGGVVGTRLSCLWAEVGLPRCEVPLERLLCLRQSCFSSAVSHYGPHANHADPAGAPSVGSSSLLSDPPPTTP